MFTTRAITGATAATDTAGHDLGDFSADVAFHDVEYLGPAHGGVGPSWWRLACRWRRGPGRGRGCRRRSGRPLIRGAGDRGAGRDSRSSRAPLGRAARRLPPRSTAPGTA